ncbi:MAG: glutamine synthetase family protein [Paracoccaceae bacterium]
MSDPVAAFRTAYPEIEAVEVFVTDLNGIARGKLLPAEQIAKAVEGRVRMPISAVGLDVLGQDVPENGNAIERGDPDGPLLPVVERLGPMLWAGRPTAQLPCVMGEADGTPCAYDPRAVLARVARMAAERGLTPVMALELEFYLVDPREPVPPLNPLCGGRLSHAREQIYDLDVLRCFEPMLGRMREAAAALGAPAETTICEFGAGQFEMNLGHVPDPLAAADHMISLKRAIRGVARAEGMDATFMAKPYGESAGSGMHLHLSLIDGAGRNLFAATEGADAPNAAVRRAIAGLLAAMADCQLIFAPHANSYRRFMPGSYAPLVAAWGLDNRGTAIRVPEAHGAGARLEHRVAGSDANPYLVAAAVLAGALAGLGAEREPPPPVPVEAGSADGTELPAAWVEAERRFSESAFVGEWLGTEFRRIFGGMKRQERARLLARVPDTEYDAYLRTV